MADPVSDIRCGLHDGESALDVPAKLSAQVRVFATGNGRKTDSADRSELSNSRILRSRNAAESRSGQVATRWRQPAEHRSWFVLGGEISRR